MVALAASACGGDEAETDDRFIPSAGSRPPAATGPIPEIATDYAAELDIDLESLTVSPTGLRYKDIQVGTGAEAAPGHNVSVRYSLWLPDGTGLESGVYPPPAGRPLILGTGSVIRGWDEGLTGMRVGGKRQLVVPSELGYGQVGSGGVIPGGATLVFEVELLSTGN